MGSYCFACVDVGAAKIPAVFADLPDLLQKVVDGEIDPSFVVTHRGMLEDGPDLYKTFRDKNDGCIKVVLRP